MSIDVRFTHASSRCLAELSWPEIKDAVRQGAAVILPVGSTEQHGPHLPLMVDFALADAIAREAAAEMAAELPVVVAPVLPFGCAHYHMDFAGTIDLPTDVFCATLEAVVGSLVHHGFGRIMVLNGHGGNHGPAGVAVRNIHAKSGVAIALSSYWQLASEEIGAIRQSGPGGVSHACELETSLMLHYFPHLVRREHFARHIPDIDRHWHAVDMFDGERVSIMESMRAYAPTGVLGDPTLASARKGAQFRAAIVQSLKRFLTRWSRTPDQAAQLRHPPEHRAKAAEVGSPGDAGIPGLENGA
jgi:creatinine amidohydrolase